jgi:hypothetical protein
MVALAVQGVEAVLAMMVVPRPLAVVPLLRQH